MFVSGGGKAVSALVITIIPDVERNSVIEVLEQKYRNLRVQPSGDSFQVVEFLNNNGVSLRLAVCVTRSAGNLAAAFHTIHGVWRFPPRFAFLCGIAGNMRPDRNQLGDVVVPKEVEFRSYNRMSAHESLESSSNTIYVQEDLFGRFRAFIEGRGSIDLVTGNPYSFDASSALTRRPRVDYEGKVFCWDLVLDCEVTREKLCKMDNRLRAVEMEAGGFLNSLRLLSSKMGYNISGLIFRGLSDQASEKSKNDGDAKVNWRKFAAQNAAKVMVEFMDDLTESDFSLGFDAGQEPPRAIVN